MDSKESTITTTFRAVPELLERLDEIAKQLGFTRNALIIKILWEHVEENNAQCENKNGATP